MNSINLLPTLESLLTEPIALQAPAFLNESRTAVIRGLETALLNVLGAFVRYGMTPAGADSLLRVLHMPNIDSSLLTQDLSGMFVGGDETYNLIDTGKSVLGLLFGQRIRDFNDVLAGMSGLASKNAALLTGMVAPFVLAVIKYAATATGPLESVVLGTVLDSQSLYLKERLSEKLLGTLGLGTQSSQVHGEVHAIGDRTKHGAMAAEPDVTERKRTWLWFDLLLVALLVLGFCMKRTLDMRQQPAIAASSPSAVSVAPSMTQDAASAVADAIPKGAGVIVATMMGKPELMVYFDYGKGELSTDFADKAKDVLAYLKDNPSSTARVSGFADSSGDPALNVELARKRTESVTAALLEAGIDASRINLAEPVEISGSTPESKDRRVEIHVQ